ncbi:MAG: PAS domain S-box protein, partial [Ferruginibacter sp.]
INKSGQVKLLFLHDKAVYLDKDNYLNYYSPSGYFTKERFPVPSNNGTNIFKNGSANNFFCVTDSVLYLVDISSGKIKLQKILSTLQNAQDILSVYQKDSNTIITGTIRNGLYVYKKQYFQASDPLPGGQSDAFYGQTLLPDNRTILTGMDKLFRDGLYAGNTKTVFTTNEYYILKDSKGNYWHTFHDDILRSREIGTRPDTMMHFKGRPGIIFEDSQNNIWVFSNELFGYFANSKFTPLTFSNFNRGNISCMQQDKDGRFLIGTRSGLFILNSINDGKLTEVPGFKSHDIRYIWPESNGQIWVCTYGQGFYLYSNKGITAFPDANGKMAYVHSIIEDAKGYCWLPTNNGLFVTAKEALMAYVKNKQEQPFYYQFSKKHGLRTNEFNGGGAPPFLILPNGHISLPSMQGLVNYDPGAINFNFSSSPILIDHIHADSVEIPVQDEFDIANNINNISFSLSTSFWGEKENELLEYQVIEKGRGPGDWLQVEGSGKINVFTPGYGDYRLLLRKRKGLGTNDYVYKEVSFHVLPKWYQTKTFILLAVLGLIGLLMGLSIWRRRYYRRANQVLKEKVEVATLELQQLNNTLEKKVEERTMAIQQGEIKFRTLVEASLVGVYIVQDEKFIYVNPRFEQIMGYNKDELIGENIMLIIPHDQRKLADEKLKVRTSGETESVHYEMKASKKDDTNVQLEIFGRRTMYEGKITIIGTMLDITERKKMEAGLREAELKFRDLVEKSMVGVYIILDGKFAYVNPRLADMFGYRQEELINSIATTQLVDPESVAFVNKSISAKIEGEIASNNYQARGLRKDGQKIWMEIYSSATLFEGKNAVIGSVLDITDRKLAKEQLIKEKDLSQSIINNLPGVFYIFDEHGEYQLWNKNHETITGYTAEEMSKMHPTKFIEENKLDLLQERMEKVFTTGYAEMEANFLRKDGTGVPYYFNGITVTYNDKLCIMGVGIDISEKKKAEQEKEHANYLLNERIKELTTLYKAGLVLQKEEKSILVTLQDFVSILPGGWQYPAITAACIKLGEMEFITPRYVAGPYSQSSTFTTGDGTTGKIEVVYLEERPAEDEGAFLAEERNLIDMLADMLRIYFTRREVIEALQKSEANLHTIFDNTDTVYALLNVNFQVIAYNQRAAAFSAAELKKGFRVHDNIIDYFPENRQADVAENLHKTIQGEHISYEINYPQEDGKVNWYYVRMFPVTGPDKVAYGMMLAVSDITEKKLLEQEILDQKVQEQKKVIRAILIGEEKERNKIGQELHDNINQILAGTKLYLGMARKAKEGREDIINESMALIDSAIEEIRTFSKGKVTPMKKVNLEELLQLLIDGLGDTTDVHTDLVYAGDGQFIEDDLKLNIYRIIQEQLNNILKHAMAKNISVRVEVTAGKIRVLVTDDGKGFDINAKKKGIGISNMINRVESFNGTISINSSPGNGCAIEIKIPF